jgi:hypothetical protein
LSINQQPFSITKCQTLASRFATFASQAVVTAAAAMCVPTVRVWNAEPSAALVAELASLAAHGELDDEGVEASYVRATSRTSNVTLQTLLDDVRGCRRVWCTASPCNAWYTTPSLQ